MTTIKKRSFSYKFPKLPEYDVKLFSLPLILAVILTALVFFYSSKELTTDYLMQVFLFSPGLYLSATILNMTYKIHILIRRIIKVCEENLNLSKKGHIYENYLLVCEDDNKQYIKACSILVYANEYNYLQT